MKGIRKMNKKYGLMAVMILIIITGAAITPIADAYAEPLSDSSMQYRIDVSRNGNYANLSISPIPSGTVYWDFDDGSFGTGSSISHTWKDGLYTIKAVVVNNNGTAQYVEKHIGFYTEEGMSQAKTNQEYRYAVYNGNNPKLTVRDELGRQASWLSYDDEHRIVTGIPTKTGTYTVKLTGNEIIEWTLIVSEGSAESPWVRFSADSVDGQIEIKNMHGNSMNSLTQYSWTVKKISNGSSIATSLDRVPNLKVDPGIYKLELDAMTYGVTTSYAQYIMVYGESEPAPEHEERTFAMLTVIFGIMAAITTMFYISTRDPRALFGTILSVIAIVVMMIL